MSEQDGIGRTSKSSSPVWSAVQSYEVSDGGGYTAALMTGGGGGPRAPMPDIMSPTV